jgi:acetyl esterase/lipase
VNFGTRFREKKGLTQEQFANISGFSQQYISGLERGRRGAPREKDMSLSYTCKKCSFPGRVYIPRNQHVRGGVLVLHGSEGGGFGIHDNTAMLLACHGYTALAYDWCGSPERPVGGLPNKVVDIPIEGPVRALLWLQRHETVRTKPIAIHGVSRGAELAMIIATLPQDPMVPRLAAVSSLSGSDRIVQGFSWKWGKKSRKKASHKKARAWLWRGEYLVPGTPIPVERCNARVLLIHGLKDKLWKAKRSKKLERRLKAVGKQVETFYMADEAHILSMLAKNQVIARLVTFLDKALP